MFRFLLQVHYYSLVITMHKFNSIEQFRNVIRNVRENSSYHGKPIPTITFEGTVKLHGTNAGVRVYADRVQAQSRERLISIADDNAGFAQFAAKNEDAFAILVGYIASVENTYPDIDGRYTIFGEWCGGNIQSKVGLNKLDKHFVIFNVYDHVLEKYISRAWMDRAISHREIPGQMLSILNDAKIHLIKEIPSHTITIDFTQPEQYIEELERLTLAVEESCPWTVYRGAEGIGEGIVWVKADDIGDNRYWFKTKGVKHQGKDQSKVKTLNVDPVKTAKMRELVDVLTPEWRLEQGVTYLRENGYTLDQKATGQYLQWVMKDILKEEQDTIAANDFAWKELTGAITTKARDFYFRALNEVAINGL